MFFSSIKEINRLLDAINRLLSKGMSNIYSQVTIEKKWRTQNFDFLNLKSSYAVSFWRVQTHAKITEFSKFLLQFEMRGLGAKLCVAFILFLFWKEIWRSKVKKSMLLIEQKQKL